MKNKPEPDSEIILYQTEDGRTRIQCRFEDETGWLTQQHMAELFQTTQQNVSLHVRNIYEEGELAVGATHTISNNQPDSLLRLAGLHQARSANTTVAVGDESARNPRKGCQNQRAA